MRVHRYSKTKQKTGRNRIEETTYSLRENSANHTPAKTRSRGVTTKKEKSSADSLRTAGSQLKRVNQSKQTGLPVQTGTQTTASEPCSVDRTPGRAYSAKLTYAKTGGPCSVIRPPRPANSAKIKAKVEVSIDSRSPSSPDIDCILPRRSPDVSPSSKKLPQVPKVRHKTVKTNADHIISLIADHNISLNSPHKGVTMVKRKAESPSEDSSTDENMTPQNAIVNIDPKKKKRRQKAAPPTINNNIRDKSSNSDTDLDDLTPAQKGKRSRQKNGWMKQRRCNQLVNVTNEHGGTSTIRKPDLPFKKKGKPGKGGHKKYRKRDLFTVKRFHTRKGLGKTMRPLFAGDHFQLRLAEADKQLQIQTLPPLRRDIWIPGSNGENGHMLVDPRRRRAHIFAL